MNNRIINIDEMIDCLSIDDLKRILKKAIEDNEELQNVVKLVGAKYYDNLDIQIYKDIIDDILNKIRLETAYNHHIHSRIVNEYYDYDDDDDDDYDDYDDYYDDDGDCNDEDNHKNLYEEVKLELYEFWNLVDSLLDNEKHELSNLIINYLYEKCLLLNEYTINKVATILDLCSAYVRDIYELADKETKKQIKEVWINTYNKGCNIRHTETIIENILPRNELLKIKLSKMIELMEKFKDWHVSLIYENALIRYTEINDELGTNESEVLEFFKKDWQLPTNRLVYIERLFLKSDFLTAVEILKESLVIDNDDERLVKKYHYKLKEAYALLEDKDNYVKQLFRLCIKEDIGNVEVFEELKAVYTQEEWIIVREKIINAIEVDYFKVKLYENEKLYDRIIYYIECEQNYNCFFTYVNELKKHYPSDVIRIYAEIVNQYSQNSSNRETYKYIVKLLRAMTRIKGGKPIVVNIVDDFKIKYKRRTAMIEELNKIKL